MINYLKNKFVLSDQGAKDLIKGSLYSALVNLSMMIPVALCITFLDEALDLFYTKNSTELPSIWKYVILFFIAIVVIYICQYFQYSSVFVLTYRESAKRRVTLAEKLRELPLSFFNKHDLSDLSNTIMEDCTSLEHSFSHVIPQFFGSIISTTVIVILLLVTDWRMGLAVLWVLPIAFIMIIGSKRLQNRLELKHYMTKRICADGVQECLENIQDIKAYNFKESYILELDKKLDNAEQASMNTELVVGSCVTSAQSVLRIGLATVILVGINLLVDGKIDLLTYLFFLVTASRLYDPLSGALLNITEIYNIQIPIMRMKEIENQVVQKGEIDFELQGYDIVFDHVGFSYDNHESVLEDISFTAKQGQVTALVGPSGGGKSTIAKLAARFWDATNGKITLGGTDITTCDPEMLLKNYAIVFQDVTLLNDTVIENIRIGKPNASNEEVLVAAQNAMCDDFVCNMPECYSTVIGENGSTLSAGQRQRISIARAILKDAPIIVLDEATAFLDVENETKIQTALSNLIKDKTVLVIAHRMRTVENADKIVVICDKSVNQQGSPEELYEKGGLYKHMVDLQTINTNSHLYQ